MHCRDYDYLNLNINKKVLQPFQVTQLGNKQCVLTHSYLTTGLGKDEKNKCHIIFAS